MTTQSQLRLDVWSDYVCPFCYLEVPFIERLREEFEPGLQVYWHAFELRPEPCQRLIPMANICIASGINRSIRWRQRGMTLKLPPVQPRSRRAFELAEFARAKGRFDETHRALFKAFFEDGRDLNNIEVLLEIGAEVGLDTKHLRAALEQGTYLERVIDDERQAQELDISAVPTTKVRRADAALEKAGVIRGAQPYDVLKAAVERAMRREAFSAVR
ncbi:MAG TPA: DsbA family protein [Burkholderiales bacterium]|nr:DsbA family protein [Burkholderiales bacterium]